VQHVKQYSVKQQIKYRIYSHISRKIYDKIFT